MTEEKRQERINVYKQRLYESLLWGRLAEARRYCVKLLDFEPESQGYQLINSFIEQWRKPNGRYGEFNSFSAKYNFIDSIIEYEIKAEKFVLCNDFNFMQFCFQCVHKENIYNIFTINKFINQLKQLEQKLSNGLNQEIINKLKEKRKNAICIIISFVLFFTFSAIMIYFAGVQK